MSHGHGILLLEVGKEWSLVVYFEIEDSVLVWETEASCVDCGVLGCCGWGEGKAVEGREHGEFELDDIACGWGKGDPLVPSIFGYLNVVGLWFY